MIMNDLLFKTQLNYQIQAQTEKLKAAKKDDSDIKSIDLHRCYFSEFKRAMEYIRENNADYSFSDFTIDAVKPAPNDFSEDKKYDFVELTDYAKHTAITIGNMTLFSELQKIASAAEQFNYNTASTQDKKAANILSFEDYDNYNIRETAPVTEELGSCVITSINDEPLKLTATLHASSTPERPIISVRAYSLTTNTYSSNIDIIDFDSIYKPNATMMEAFAYMSYVDHTNNKFNHSFDKLLVSQSHGIDTLDDMYSQHYDLRTFDYLNQ